MKRILMTLAALMLACTLSVTAVAEDTSAAASLTEARTAYAAAKQSASLTNYETELNSMVDAGSLTREQADLLLTAAKETIALRSGTCPECGYQFQTTAGYRCSNGFGKTIGKNTRTAAVSAATDTTALQQAQAAYSTAKQNSQLTEYEAELKSMVAAGTLTQEQADLLLNAATEAEALSNGICPSCGYQFQTATGIGNGKTAQMRTGLKNGSGRGSKR